jgi:hypothetical protein
MSSGKSIQEVLKEMNTKKIVQQNIVRESEKKVLELREDRRKNYLLDNKLLEKIGPNSSPSSSSPSAGGGNANQEWISQIDTIWLYPQEDIDNFLGTLQLTILGSDVYSYQAIGLSPSVSFTKNVNVYSFEDLNSLVYFFEEVYKQTEISQPLGNAGYSLGVGTITRARRNDRLILKLDSGIKVIEWALMTQITNQSDLPTGGNSPNGTVGWGQIYCDWNLDGEQDQTNLAGDISNYVDGLVFRRI